MRRSLGPLCPLAGAFRLQGCERQIAQRLCARVARCEEQRMTGSAEGERVRVLEVARVTLCPASV